MYEVCCCKKITPLSQKQKLPHVVSFCYITFWQQLEESVQGERLVKRKNLKIDILATLKPLWKTVFELKDEVEAVWAKQGKKTIFGKPLQIRTSRIITLLERFETEGLVERRIRAEQRSRIRSRDSIPRQIEWRLSEEGVRVRRERLEEKRDSDIARLRPLSA